MSELRTFGRFGFDPATLELFDADERVPLEPMPARILVRLLERPGEMVPREELLELGWPKLPQVADASLNTCVRQIRAALGDDAREPRFVETLRGRGYRFIAPVETNRVVETGAAAQGLARGWRWARLVGPGGGVLALAAAALVALAAWERGPDRIPEDVRSELTKARLVFDRYHDAEKALELVDPLAAEHPDVARVHTQRAELLLMLGRLQETERAVEVGLALDAGDPVGQRVRGALHMFQARWEAAEAALGRSLERAPEDAATWVAHAYLTTVLGRFAEAERSIGRALELDPLSPTVQGDVGLLHMWAGRYEEAVGSCREVIALADEPPAWAIECAFDALVLSGRAEEAVDWAAPLMVRARLVPADVLAGGSVSEDADAVVRSLLGARLGVVRAWQASGRPVGSYAVALASARAEQVEAALESLEAAAREPGFAVLSAAVDPRFALLHDEPRFRALVSRLGLEIVG